MNPSKYITFLFLLVAQIFFSQEKVTINGTVYDNNSNETLIGVSVYFPELKTGTTTNEYGFYSITVPKGNYKIQVSYLGFKSIIENLNLTVNVTKNFKLEEETESLDEIIIEGTVTNIELHKKILSSEDFKKGSVSIKWLEENIESL